MSGELREEPPAGAVLKCALAGGLVAESVHSGVYLGGGRVAELRGDGALVAVSPSEFLNGVAGEWDLAALRTGFRIYAACDAGSGAAVGSAEAASRARALTEGRSGRLRVRYDLAVGNCHRFAAGCVAGRFGGEANEGRWTLGRLEAIVLRELNGGRPLVWRAVWPETPGFRYAATPGKQLQHWALVGVAIGLGGWGAERATGKSQGQFDHPAAERGQTKYGGRAGAHTVFRPERSMLKAFLQWRV